MIVTKNEIHVDVGINSKLIVTKLGEDQSKVGNISFRIKNNIEYTAPTATDDMSDDVKSELLEMIALIEAALSPIREGCEFVFGEEYVTYDIELKIINKFNAWKSLQHLIISILIPELPVENEYGLSTKIRNLAMRTCVATYTSSHISFSFVQGQRYTLSFREKYKDYGHSHLRGTSPGFDHFCLGRSELSMCINSTLPHSSIDYFFGLMRSLADTESIAGTPYRHISEIIDVRQTLNAIISGSVVNQLPVVTASTVASTIKNAVDAGVQFPLEIKQIGDNGGEIILRDDATEELKSILTQYAPDSLKVSIIKKVDQGMTADNIRKRLGISSYRPSLNPLMFNNVNYKTQEICADEAELKIIVPKVDKTAVKSKDDSKLVLEDVTLNTLLGRVKTIINNKLEYEPRWDI